MIGTSRFGIPPAHTTQKHSCCSIINPSPCLLPLTRRIQRPRCAAWAVWRTMPRTPPRQKSARPPPQRSHRIQKKSLPAPPLPHRMRQPTRCRSLSDRLHMDGLPALWRRWGVGLCTHTHTLIVSHTTTHDTHKAARVLPQRTRTHAGARIDSAQHAPVAPARREASDEPHLWAEEAAGAGAVARCVFVVRWMDCSVEACLCLLVQGKSGVGWGRGAVDRSLRSLRSIDRDSHAAGVGHGLIWSMRRVGGLWRVPPLWGRTGA